MYILNIFHTYAQIFPSKRKSKIGRKMTYSLTDNAYKTASLLIMLFYHNKHQKMVLERHLNMKDSLDVILYVVQVHFLQSSLII